MIRRIIKIDEEKCNGCGLCAAACHEGAIDIVDNKAKLMRENYCDGLGDCLPACPMNAISFEEREAPAYDEAAVKAAQAAKAAKNEKKTAIFSGCPGSKARSIERPKNSAVSSPCESQLSQWPVQIKLLPITAPYFDGADILIAADCTAYAYGDFHNKFIKGRITLVGCPKLDEGDYTEKLTAIFANNNIKSVTMTRMIVPCCGALERAAKNAIKNSKKEIPFEVYTISTDGSIL
ncbi:MAG: ATP-binding protein [Lachnospiraceae bacterium]